MIGLHLLCFRITITLCVFVIHKFLLNAKLVLFCVFPKIYTNIKNHITFRIDRKKDYVLKKKCFLLFLNQKLHYS